ncbi:hypothetical protein MRX96_039720 [Rhipicephalus microplus]
MSITNSLPEQKYDDNHSQYDEDYYHDDDHYHDDYYHDDNYNDYHDNEYHYDYYDHYHHDNDHKHYYDDDYSYTAYDATHKKDAAHSKTKRVLNTKSRTTTIFRFKKGVPLPDDGLCDAIILDSMYRNGQYEFFTSEDLSSWDQNVKDFIAMIGTVYDITKVAIGFDG